MSYQWVQSDFFGKIYSLKTDTIQRFLLTRPLRAYLAAETSFKKNAFPVGETCRFAFLDKYRAKVSVDGGCVDKLGDYWGLNLKKSNLLRNIQGNRLMFLADSDSVLSAGDAVQ